MAQTGYAKATEQIYQIGGIRITKKDAEVSRTQRIMLQQNTAQLTDRISELERRDEFDDDTDMLSMFVPRWPKGLPHNKNEIRRQYHAKEKSIATLTQAISKLETAIANEENTGKNCESEGLTLARETLSNLRLGKSASSNYQNALKEVWHMLYPTETFT